MMRGRMPEQKKPFVILALRIAGCAVALVGIIQIVRYWDKNDAAVEAGIVTLAGSVFFFAMARIVDYLRRIALK
jgi:hypothetical protein